MNIGLIAHDAKKELMVQFCIAYCGILSRHTLCATGTTGKLVSEATGLNIKRFLAGPQGGDQQLAALIGCEEVDLLLFFRDPLSPKPDEPNDMISASHNPAEYNGIKIFSGDGYKLPDALEEQIESIVLDHAHHLHVHPDAGRQTVLSEGACRPADRGV